MYAKISVLVPTRHRPSQLKTLIASFLETTTPGLAELCFRIDDDDAVSAALLAGRGTVVVGPRLRGYRSIGEFFNELFEASTGDVILLGNDDMVFRTPGWAERVLAAAAQYPDGLFDFGVETHNAVNFPFTIVSRTAVQTVGCIAPAGINWVDIYWRDMMTQFGRAIRLPGVIIDHEWMGWTPDAVWTDGNQADPALWSPDYWNGTHAPAVSSGADRLRSDA